MPLNGDALSLSRPVKIGDIISLSLVGGDGDGDGDGQCDEDAVFYLNAGGILDEAVTVAAQWSSENLFEVCTRAHVTSTEECIAWKTAHGNDIVTSDEEKKVEDALMRVMGKEQERNKATMEEMRGNHVRFGRIIQLRHVRSNTYLTVPRLRAAWSPGLELSKTASSGCWFCFTPSTKLYAAGDPVMSGCDCSLQVSGEDADEFVFAGSARKRMSQLRNLFVEPNLAAGAASYGSAPVLEPCLGLTKGIWRPALFTEHSRQPRPGQRQGLQQGGAKSGSPEEGSASTSAAPAPAGSRPDPDPETDTDPEPAVAMTQLIFLNDAELGVSLAMGGIAAADIADKARMEVAADAPDTPGAQAGPLGGAQRRRQAAAEQWLSAVPYFSRERNSTGLWAVERLDSMQGGFVSFHGEGEAALHAVAGAGGGGGTGARRDQSQEHDSRCLLRHLNSGRYLAIGVTANGFKQVTSQAFDPGAGAGPPPLQIVFELSRVSAVHGNGSSSAVCHMDAVWVSHDGWRLASGATAAAVHELVPAAAASPVCVQPKQAAGRGGGRDLQAGEAEGSRFHSRDSREGGDLLALAATAARAVPVPLRVCKFSEEPGFSVQKEGDCRLGRDSVMAMSHALATGDAGGARDRLNPEHYSVVLRGVLEQLLEFLQQAAEEGPERVREARGLLREQGVLCLLVEILQRSTDEEAEDKFNSRAEEWGYQELEEGGARDPPPAPPSAADPDAPLDLDAAAAAVDTGAASKPHGGVPAPTTLAEAGVRHLCLATLQEVIRDDSENKRRVATRALVLFRCMFADGDRPESRASSSESRPSSSDWNSGSGGGSGGSGGSGGLAEEPGSTALALLCAEDVFAERSVIEHYVSRTCLRALLNELAAARANGSWNHDILGVLHRMCSCGGVAVVQNQLLIAEYLLGSQSTAGSAVLAAKSRRRKVSSLKAGTNKLEQLEKEAEADVAQDKVSQAEARANQVQVSPRLQAQLRGLRLRFHADSRARGLDHRQYFNTVLDRDRSGGVDLSEFAEACRRFAILDGEEVIQSLMAFMDTDGDGEIDVEEFVDFVNKPSVAPPGPTGLRGLLVRVLPNGSCLLPGCGADAPPTRITDTPPECQSYLAAQLRLFAGLSLDRNMRIIDHMRTRISYDGAVRASSDPTLSGEVRAAFIRFIAAVYVDCPGRQKMVEPLNLMFVATAVPQSVSSVTMPSAVAAVGRAANKPLFAEKQPAGGSGSLMDKCCPPTKRMAMSWLAKSPAIAWRSLSESSGSKLRRRASFAEHVQPGDSTAGLPQMLEEGLSFDSLVTSAVDNGGPLLLRGEARQWDELSQSSMHLLHQLVEFGFFFGGGRFAAVGNGWSQNTLQSMLGTVVSALKADTVESNTSSSGPSRASLEADGLAKATPNQVVPHAGLTSRPGLLRQSSFVPAALTKGIAKQAQLASALREGKKTFRKRMLKVLDGIPMTATIILMVFAALAVANMQGDAKNIYYDVWDNFVFGAFALELLLRMFCVNSFKLFFTNPFAVIDFIVVMLDVVIMLAAGMMGDMEGSTKALRALRSVRLLRLLKVARLMQSLRDARKPKALPPWKLPQQFCNPPQLKMASLRHLMAVLTRTAEADRCFRLHQAVAMVAAAHRQSASRLHLRRGSQTTRVTDDVLFDACSVPCVEFCKDEGHKSEPLTTVLLYMVLYSDSPLVQAGLEFMMLYTSAHQHLVADLGSVQFVEDKKDEEEYHGLQQDCMELAMRIEWLELWEWDGEEGDHPDSAVHKRQQASKGGASGNTPAEDSAGMLKVLDRLTELLERAERPRRRLFQDMLRNVGLTKLCVMLLHKLQSEAKAAKLTGRVQEDGGMHSVAINRSCLSLLAWYLHECPANQESLYPQLDFFRAQLADGDPTIAVVLAELVRCNQSLLQILPHDFIAGVFSALQARADCGGSREPSMLYLLAATTRFDQWSYAEKNQLAVLQGPTGALLLCEDPGGEEYLERERLCEPLLRQQRLHTRRASTALAVADDGIPEPQPSDEATFLKINGTSRGLKEDAPERCRKLPSTLGLSQDLPRELQYHIASLHLLSECTGAHITVTEIMCQQLYLLPKLLTALTNPGLVLAVKHALGRFLLGAYLETSSPVPKFGSLPATWSYLQTFAHEANALAEALECGMEMDAVLKARCRYVLEVLVPCAGVFFRAYFNPSEVPPGAGLEAGGAAAGASAGAVGVGEYGQTAVATVKMLLEMSRAFDRCLPSVQKRRRLGKHSDRLQLAVDTMRHATKAAEREVASWGMSTKHLHDGKHRRPQAAEEARPAAETAGLSIARMRAPSVKPAPLPPRSPWSKQMAEFARSARSKALTQQRMLALARHLGNLPALGAHKLHAPLRKEFVIGKLVAHASGLVQPAQDGLSRRLLPEHVQTTIWLLQLLRTMIESKLGRSTMEGSGAAPVVLEACAEQAEEVQLMLNGCGATALCIDLIAVGIERAVLKEAVLLLWALLAREGGNEKVQATFRAHLSKGGSAFFFHQLQRQINDLVLWHEQVCHMRPSGEAAATRAKSIRKAPTEPFPTGMVYDEDDDVIDENDEVGTISETGLYLVKTLRLTCEGHYLPNQELFIAQPKNGTDSVSVLVSVAAALHEILFPDNASHENVRTRVSTLTSCMLTRWLLEVTQGPCHAAQMELALHTHLLKTISRAVRTVPENDQVLDEENELKRLLLCVLQALIEGNDGEDGAQVYDRIMAVVHVESLQTFLAPPPEPELEGLDPDDAMAVFDEYRRELARPLNPLQIQSLLLIQSLIQYDQSLSWLIDSYTEGKLGTEVQSIEVVWNGKVQTRHFHVPEVCRFLGDETRDHLMLTIDRENYDRKMHEFTARSKVMLCEIQHLQVLDQQGVSGMFNRNMQNQMTWFTFILNLGINFGYVWYFSWPMSADGSKRLVDQGISLGPEEIQHPMKALNYMQVRRRAERLLARHSALALLGYDALSAALLHSHLSSLLLSARLLHSHCRVPPFHTAHLTACSSPPTSRCLDRLLRGDAHHVFGGARPRGLPRGRARDALCHPGAAGSDPGLLQHLLRPVCRGGDLRRAREPVLELHTAVRHRRQESHLQRRAAVCLDPAQADRCHDRAGQFHYVYLLVPGVQLLPGPRAGPRLRLAVQLHADRDQLRVTQQRRHRGLHGDGLDRIAGR
jgi:hypothetical protein